MVDDLSLCARLLIYAPASTSSSKLDIISDGLNCDKRSSIFAPLSSNLSRWRIISWVSSFGMIASTHAPA